MPTLNFTCSDERCQQELEIEITIEPIIPARLHGHPDTWCEAEGGDVEIVEGIVCDGDILDEDNKFVRKCEKVYSDTSDIPNFHLLIDKCIADMKYDCDGPDTIEEMYD